MKAPTDIAPPCESAAVSGLDHRFVVRSATAWESIGWDDGLFRIKGGRTTYEAVMYNCANNGAKVKLAKLVPANGGVREVSRYVAPDTVLEFLSSHNTEVSDR